jgi:hypothetical protein
VSPTIPEFAYDIVPDGSKYLFEAADFLYAESLNVNDWDLACVSSLPSLEIIRIEHCPVSGEFLRHCRCARKLEILILRGTSLTDACTEEIARFSRVSSLDLGETGITDKSMLHLKHLANLRVLHVDGTLVTNHGVGHL